MLPLMVCAAFGEAKAAKVLLENGADPNAAAPSGQFLETAVQNGHVEVAKLLRAAGAKGASDLAFAISTKDVREIERLLQSAPSFADQPEFWSKALLIAARSGQIHAVRVALDKGVPPHPDGEADAIAAAAFEGQHEVLAEFLSRRPRSSNPAELRQSLWNAILNSCPSPGQRPAKDFERCVKLLLEAGTPVADADGHNELVVTAVFTRMSGGNSKVLEMLVAAGADPNPAVGGDESQRLNVQIQHACSERGYSIPSEETIKTFEKLAKVTIKR